MRRHLPPLVELTLARLREFLREPEALFWVFAFPVLLALALGLAFRGKAPDKIPVGVAEGPRAAATADALGRSPGLARPRLRGPGRPRGAPHREDLPPRRGRTAASSTASTRPAPTPAPPASRSTTPSSGPPGARTRSAPARPASRSPARGTSTSSSRASSG